VLLFHSESTICTAVIIITNYIDISGADRAATTRIKRESLENLKYLMYKLLDDNDNLNCGPYNKNQIDPLFIL
jgi:hypothetical protein